VNTTASAWGNQASEAPQPRIYRIELVANEFDIRFVTSSALLYRGSVTFLEAEEPKEPLPESAQEATPLAGRCFHQAGYPGRRTGR